MMVLQLMVKNTKGEMEKVILCTTVWTDKPRMREAYTLSEFDWMVVEVNTLWRRQHRTLNMKSKRIPFFCRLCNKDMVDKSELAWHRQQDLCPLYDVTKDGPLKMFPVNGAKGNSEIAAVFKMYNMKLPWQNRGIGGSRPVDESSVETMEMEEAVHLSNDGSSGGSAHTAQPPLKRRTVDRSTMDGIGDARTRQQDQGMKDAGSSGRKAKGTTKDKGKGGGDHTVKPQASSRTTTPQRPMGKRRSPLMSPSAKTRGPGVRPGSTFAPGAVPLDSRPPPPMNPRAKLEACLRIRATAKFPEVSAGEAPVKPGKPPGLYSLIEQTGDVIDLELLTCLQKAKDAVLNLHAIGLLGRKIFNAWGVFSVDPTIRVSTLPFCP